MRRWREERLCSAGRRYAITTPNRCKIRAQDVLSFTRSKKETAIIRRIFKGEPEAYRLLIEQYQPMAYAVALALTGNVVLADKAMVAAFKEGFGRLASLTDAKRLGFLFCTLAQHEAEQLINRRVQDWNRPRKRGDASAPVDMKWVQSELLDPLNEELGPFSVRERKGLLLHAFSGATARQIADALKIERKEAEEDLARTQENVEKALLKEVVNALHLEVNNKERLVSILTLVAGAEAAAKAARQTSIGKPKRKRAPMLIGVIAVLVLSIGGYFGYRVFAAPAIGESDAPPIAAGESSGGAAVDGAAASEQPRAVPSNYSLSGRVVDNRFVEDGVAGLTVKAGELSAETDFYGSFEIRGMQRGQHEVVILSDGVELKQGIRLHTEERNQSIEIEVDHRVPTRFRFNGRVTDRQTGQVITRFESATCKDNPEMLQPYLLRRFREQEDPEGRLTDRFVTIGDYTTYVRAHGYAPLPLHFVIDENWDNCKVHELPLYRAASLEMTVYGANELSISGLSVMPRQGTAYGTAVGFVEYGRTDSMGRLSLYSMPIGIQSFLLHHLTQGTGQAIVELEPGKTTQVRIQLPKRSSLTGDITINKRPAAFKEFRRRANGSGIDLTKNVVYNAPGQYEINLTPESVSIWASVAPLEGDRWFARRMEREAVVVMDSPTWLDFNFGSGAGMIQGNVSLQGGTARAVYVEVTYSFERSNDRERIYYDFGAAGTFRIENLPYGSGEATVFASPRATTREDFESARVLMEKRSSPFTLDDTNEYAYLDFAL